jgi:hypothetical protein
LPQAPVVFGRVQVAADVEDVPGEHAPPIPARVSAPSCSAIRFFPHEGNREAPIVGLRGYFQA